MGIFSWIIFGLFAGVVAKLLLPGRDPGGCIITMLLGIAGSLIGGFFYEIVTGRPQYTQFNLPSFIIAVIGALVLLIIYRLLIGGRRGRRRA